MTAPVAPMEARCSVCLDTGSKSKHLDGDLDCVACEAVQQRMALREYMAQYIGWPDKDALTWVACLFAQRQAAPVAAQPAMPKLPSTPEEAIVFIGGHFQFMDIEGVPEDRRISLTVHDLLSAFQNLADVAGEAAQPVEVAGQVLSADDVQWITNDNAELGVKIGNQFFFLYKGGSLVYENGTHDDDTPMMYRPVFKREFGECAHPINHADYSKTGTVSLSDSDEWKPIPAAPQPAAHPSDDVVRDAARYRWLRASGDTISDMSILGADGIIPEALDDEIDVAMAKEKA